MTLKDVFSWVWNDLNLFYVWGGIVALSLIYFVNECWQNYYQERKKKIDKICNRVLLWAGIFSVSIIALGIIISIIHE